MKSLGLNLGVTRAAKTLKDGSVCVIENGRIMVAVAEERVCRKKYAGGFRHALEYCLNTTDLRLDDFDAIVVSSCCEDVCPTKIEDLPLEDDSRLHFIQSHHLSHAYSAFCVSPFDRALIIIMDAGGNVIGRQNHPEWWRNPREQTSYFIGEGTAITLIGRDFDEPYEVGFGEAYRCFTYYLGWHSSSYAGNTMALAAYGDSERFAGVNLFELHNGRLRCKLRNDPFHPIEMLKQFAQESGVDLGNSRLKDSEILQHHMDLASFIQNQLEKALIEKIRVLCDKTGITNICIAGGVGLNCVANSRILTDTPVQHLFIQPAAGDQGQALGNALYGYHHLLGKPRATVMTNVYFGREYFNDTQQDTVSDSSNNNEFELRRSTSIARDTARLIANGFVVGWFQGRSELGPRALGNRSILADPRRITSKEHLNKNIKHREWFRPYAPSILEEYTSEFFDIDVVSPFMLLVARVKPNKKSLVPAIIHVDDTARLHTVSQKENPRYYKLIDEYRKLTGIPLILNTSFNGQGEPIVETPQDAIQCFKEQDLDILVIGDYLITRHYTRTRRAEISWTKTGMISKQYDVKQLSIPQLHDQICSDFPDYKLIFRDKFRLVPEYVKWLQNGTKCTTVRYRSDGIDIPKALELPLIESSEDDNNSIHHDIPNHQVGIVTIVDMVIKPFVMLDDQDARRDGFSTEDELKKALKRLYNPIYSSIDNNQYVSIYTIHLSD